MGDQVLVQVAERKKQSAKDKEVAETVTAFLKEAGVIEKTMMEKRRQAAAKISAAWQRCKLRSKAKKANSIKSVNQIEGDSTITASKAVIDCASLTARLTHIMGSTLI